MLVSILLLLTHTSDFSLKTPLRSVSGGIQRIGSLVFPVEVYSNVSFASPKSLIFSSSLSPTKMLRQARSRWMTPFDCRYSYTRYTQCSIYTQCAQYIAVHVCSITYLVYHSHHSTSNLPSKASEALEMLINVWSMCLMGGRTYIQISYFICT